MATQDWKAVLQAMLNKDFAPKEDKDEEDKGESITVKNADGTSTEIFRKNMSDAEWNALKNRAPDLEMKPEKIQAGKDPGGATLPEDVNSALAKGQEAVNEVTREQPGPPEGEGMTPEELNQWDNARPSGGMKPEELNQWDSARPPSKLTESDTEKPSVKVKVGAPTTVSRSGLTQKRAVDIANDWLMEHGGPDDKANQWQHKSIVSGLMSGDLAPEDVLKQTSPKFRSEGGQTGGGGMSSRMPFPVDDLKGAAIIPGPSDATPEERARRAEALTNISGYGGTEATQEALARAEQRKNQATQFAIPSGGMRPGAADEAATFAQAAENARSRLGGPELGGMAGKQDLIAQGVPPAGAPVSVPAPGPAMQQSVSVAGRGGTTRPGLNFQAYDPTADLKASADATEQYNKALLAKAAVDAEAEQIKGRRDDQQAIEAGLRAKREEVIRQAGEKAFKDHTDAVNALRVQHLDMLKQGVDPDRFWKNRSGFQKAAGVISAAFYGLAGNTRAVDDMWNGLQAAAQADVRLQQAEFERKGGIIKDAMAWENSTYAQARQMGLDQMSASEAAYNAKMEELKHFADGLLARNAAAGQQPAAMMLSAKFMQDQAVQDAKLKQLGISSANDAANMKRMELHDRALEAQGWARLRIEQQKADTKAAGGGKGRPPPVSIQNELASYRNAIISAKEALDINPKHIKGLGYLQAAWNKIWSVIPGSDEKAASQRMDMLAREAARGIEKGRLDKSDWEYYGPRLASYGDLALGGTTEVMKNAKEKYRQARLAAAGEGYDMSGYPETLDESAGQAPPKDVLK